MQTLTSYTLTIDAVFSEEDLRKGIHLVILHATRIPPHIGIIAAGKYHSLTIKGQEVNQSAEALIKNIRIRKIPALFIKIKPHLTFSTDYLNEHFIQDVRHFSKVEINASTCLSPVKLFFAGVYGLSLDNINYIFELLPLLEKEGILGSSSALFVNETRFQLPVYDLNQINKGIEDANNEVRQIRELQKSKI
jgi:hypothetical protein